METITVTQPVPDISGNAFLPPVALVPFRQDSHDSAHPVVTEGTRVKEGQLIARGTAPATSRIHAPVPGMIRSFKKISCPDGGTSIAAEILLSGSFDILGRKEENFSWKTSPESEIIRILEDKGVVSTFEEPVPLVELIRDAKKQKNPVILVRLFDLDPTCQLDSILFKEFPDKVVEGAALIAKALNIRSLYFVTDQDLDTGAITRAAEPMEAVILKTDTRYPSGNRKQLVKILPEAEQNRPGIFLDPSTAITAYEAVVHNEPVVYRYVFVSGPAVARTSILKVRIGTTLAALIQESGGFTSPPSRIITNGLITGTAVQDLSTPITKTTKSVHIMDKESCPDYTVHDCIHCGRCLQVCPVYIDPMELVEVIKNKKIRQKHIRSIESCQHCGCCTMVCPSRIPLHHILKNAREAGFREEDK